jgi:hypothetical protein
MSEKKVRATRGSPVRHPRSKWWMLAKDDDLRAEVLLANCDGEHALPVFSGEGEAELGTIGEVDRDGDVFLPGSTPDGAKVKLRQGPFPEEPDALIALAEEATSWRWQLCNLRTALEAKHDMRKVRPL